VSTRVFRALRDKRKLAAGYTSGGEQQMIALGRALMGQPKLILLDERQPAEVESYDAFGVVPSVSNIQPGALDPYAYGGSQILENGEGVGNLVTSTPTIVKLLAHYRVWNWDSSHLTGREQGVRYGAYSGTVSAAVSINATDYAIVVNRWVELGELRCASEHGT